MAKKTFAALAAVGVFGITLASAATLGGLNSVSLGADQTVVTSCDSDGIGVAYTNAFDAASGKYNTTEVVLSDIAPGCAGQSFQLTLSDGSTALVEASGTVAENETQTVVLPTAVAADQVNAAALVITG